MGLIGTMYNGVNGLNRMGDSMAVLGDNIANANTVAFKSSRTTFADRVVEDKDSGQSGSGALLSSVDVRFTPGGMEKTTVATDMAIGGEGFFIVNDPQLSGVDLYTRDGQFKLIESAAGSDSLNLVNQFGYFVQGYPVAAAGTGGFSDIVVSRVAPPKATTTVDLALNLGESGVTETTDTPLYARWDGTKMNGAASSPLSNGDFTYKTSFAIFDAAGDTHDITAYFDDTASLAEKEFLITCDPAIDHRVDNAGNQINTGAVPTDKGAGALLYGIMHFNSNGDLETINAYNVPSDGNVDHTNATNQIDLPRGEAYYSFPYNFAAGGTNNSVTLRLGYEPAPQRIVSSAPARKTGPDTLPILVTPQTKWDSVYDTNGNKAAAGDVITFTGSRGDGTAVSYAYTIDPAQTVNDLLVNLANQFNATTDLVDGQLQLTDSEIGDSQLAITAITYHDAGGGDVTANPALAQIFGGDGSSFDLTRQDRFSATPIATTNFSTKSATLYQRQDGYGAGFLKDISVDQKGIISGAYSNGAVLKEAQVALAKFTNPAGLVKETGNLFLVTKDAGTITSGIAGAGGFGALYGNNLESSNVDLGKEFVNLIMTQRAFQANTKSITTADAIYEQLIRLIR